MENEIKNIDQLIQALDRTMEEGGSYLKVMKQVAIPQEELERYYTWRDDRPTRNCVVNKGDYELLLICWEKDQASPVHDFNSQAAWVHPIIGEVHEERFRWFDGGKEKLEKVSSVLLTPREFSFMEDPIAIHRFINANDSRSGRTVTLNLYSKPIERWTEYDPETGAQREVEVAYDSMAGEPVRS